MDAVAETARECLLATFDHQALAGCTESDFDRLAGCRVYCATVHTKVAEPETPSVSVAVTVTV